MTEEKTLDEALEEVDRWSAKVVATIENLTPKQLVEYFNRPSSQPRVRNKSRRRVRKTRARK
jgi:hypothetical protein